MTQRLSHLSCAKAELGREPHDKLQEALSPHLLPRVGEELGASKAIGCGTLSVISRHPEDLLKAEARERESLDAWLSSVPQPSYS